MGPGFFFTIAEYEELVFNIDAGFPPVSSMILGGWLFDTDVILFPLHWLSISDGALPSLSVSFLASVGSWCLVSCGVGIVVSSFSLSFEVDISVSPGDCPVFTASFALPSLSCVTF